MSNPGDSVELSYPRTVVPARCPHCHRLFAPSRANRRYCSAACQRAAKAKRHYERSKAR